MSNGVCGARHLVEIRRLKQLGYDGVEIPILTGQPTHYAWLGKELDAIGLRRTATSVVPSPDASPISSDREIRRRGIAHLDWAFDCARELGAESLGGPMHAPIGHFVGSGPTESELAYAADAHRALAERAAAHDMYLSLEALNRFETYFLNTMAQAKAYAERVGHPAFRIMFDTFHANIEEQSMTGAVETIAGHIGVVHVSENDRGIPGRGHIDFASVFRAVHYTGFDGWVTLEAFGSGLPELAAATRVWRPLFPDFDTLFSESIGFIRKTWDEAAP
ncbi:MAG: sugar phosphate isomerase/epimerase family protein [Devosia sp.]